VILTLDLGTSATKAALWEPDGLVGLADVGLVTASPAPGVMEQDPAAWWASVVAACAELGRSRPDGLAGVEAVGLTGARQTFGLFDAGGDPTGPGILWSDARAPSVAGRLAWVADHRADQLARSSWILAPRDLVAWRLTGSAAPAPTRASLTGCYDSDGTVSAAVDGSVAERLPPVVPSDRVAPAVGEAAVLGLRPGVPVVLGAGDRQCEVLGTGAGVTVPMVSWGTTANTSLPVDARPDPSPAGLTVARSASGGWQLEGGLSAAGSFLAWLGRLCGRSSADLVALAATSPPGARGVTALPWLGGARAPWWRPGAGAAFTGLADAHDATDLARAAVESVALDVQRCLEAVGRGLPPGPGFDGLGLAGGGAPVAVWQEVLAGTTGLPVHHRRSGQAASAGAALLAAGATVGPWDLDLLDPVAGGTHPDPALVDRYAALRPAADRLAADLVDPGSPPACD